MRRLLFATGNPGKRREVARILTGLPLELLFPSDLGLALDPEETGMTFRENASIKARAFAAAAPGMWVAAEDSGLVVDALGGEPGVNSARWGGTRDDTAHNTLLLGRLAKIPGADRACHYEASIVLLDPMGSESVFGGRVDGLIAGGPAGARGFGYDPLFFSPELGCTFAEAEPADKDRLSHRGRALQALRTALEGAP